jgi:hypothetical protein
MDGKSKWALVMHRYEMEWTHMTKVEQKLFWKLVKLEYKIE